MSSNIEVTKVCELCGALFVARKTTTRFCSHRCSSAAYKARKRDKLVGRMKEKTEQELLNLRLAKVQVKPILSITDAALLLGVSRPTVYAYLKRGELKCFRLGSKTFIRLDEIYQKFDAISATSFKPVAIKSPILDVYTIEQIKEKYPVSESWIYKVIRTEKIPKTMQRGRAYYSAKHIDKHLAKPQKPAEILEWYTVEEAMAKYDLTRDSLYHIMKRNGITKIKAGRHIKIAAAELDKIFEKPIIL